MKYGLNKVQYIFSLSVVLLMAVFMTACNSGSTQSSDKAITSYSLVGASGIINGQNISVTLPYGSSMSNLIANFTISGTEADVNDNKQISGETSNDFTNPLTYTVTAEDGSTTDYTVTVTVASSTDKAITSYSLDGVDGVIKGGSISVIMPLGTKLDALTAKFTTTGLNVAIDGVTQVSDETSNGFTNPLTYTVTAADGSTTDYIVTVTVALSSAKEISSYSINGTNALIDESNSTITLTLPRSAEINHLKATFATTGEKVDINGITQSNETENDFTHPVIYTVTAADGSSRTYSVIVYVGAYAYITNGEGNNISQCLVDSISGDLTNCYIVESGLGYPSSMAINNGSAYITNHNYNNVVKCTIDKVSGALTDCANSSYSFYTPNSIVFNGGFAYISGNVSKYITKCSVDSTTNNLNNCVTEGLSGVKLGSVAGVTINNNIAYIANGNNITQCSVDTINGELDNCVTNPLTFNVPYATVISNDFAYITNSGNNTVSQCMFNSTTGELSDCNPTGSSLSVPHGIVINNNFAYIANAVKSSGISQCKIDPANGNLTECKIVKDSSFNTTTNITIY